jgi:hypothetical protein
MYIIHTTGNKNAPEAIALGHHMRKQTVLSQLVVFLVVILHAVAKDLHSLEIFEHDRLAALLTDTVSYKIPIIALRQRGARCLGKLALLRHDSSNSSTGWMVFDAKRFLTAHRYSEVYHTQAKGHSIPAAQIAEYPICDTRQRLVCIHNEP